MPYRKNKIIIASAGSRKTTHIVEESLRMKDKRILITTYTNENIDQINSYLIEKNGGCIPSNITVLTWYSFLLQEGVRPYQKTLTLRDRISSIVFNEIPFSIQRISKSNTDIYYLTRSNDIYRDRVSDFVCNVDDVSNGAVINRLQNIYDYIFIDEVQDFAGYDLNILEKLFNSTIFITAVGDPRQATFSTNNSSKNKKFKKAQIFDWVNEKEKEKLISVEQRNDCYRCNQLICDFGDLLFPQLPKSISKYTEITEHDGIFFIQKEEVLEYVRQYNPTILRWNKKSDTMELKATNIGISKGRTYQRVLIFPTKPMIEYLKTKDISKAGDISKLYVAITRARNSVTFVKL